MHACSTERPTLHLLCVIGRDLGFSYSCQTSQAGRESGAKPQGCKARLLDEPVVSRWLVMAGQIAFLIGTAAGLMHLTDGIGPKDSSGGCHPGPSPSGPPLTGAHVLHAFPAEQLEAARSDGRAPTCFLSSCWRHQLIRTRTSALRVNFQLAGLDWVIRNPGPTPAPGAD